MMINNCMCIVLTDKFFEFTMNNMYDCKYFAREKLSFFDDTENVATKFDKSLRI